jgi:hypothetical protein
MWRTSRSWIGRSLSPHTHCHSNGLGMHTILFEWIVKPASIFAIWMDVINLMTIMLHLRASTYGIKLTDWLASCWLVKICPPSVISGTWVSLMFPHQRVRGFRKQNSVGVALLISWWCPDKSQKQNSGHIHRLLASLCKPGAKPADMRLLCYDFFFCRTTENGRIHHVDNVTTSCQQVRTSRKSIKAGKGRI